MNRPNEAVNTTSESSAVDKHEDIRVSEFLFDATHPRAAVVACAMSGPKIPPYSGD